MTSSVSDDAIDDLQGGAVNNDPTESVTCPSYSPPGQIGHAQGAEKLPRGWPVGVAVLAKNGSVHFTTVDSHTLYGES